MPINPWITRALISVAGSVVTTTAIVTTAKQPNKKKKRRKKRGKGKDGVKVEEEVPRSMGAQAAHDYRSGFDGGMTTSELIENIKGSGGAVKRGLAYIGGGLFGTNRKGPPPQEGEEAAETGDRPKKRRRRPPDGKKRRRRRGPPPKGKRRRRPPPKKNEKGDFAAIRDEVAKAAANRVAKGAADKVGAGEVLDNIKDGAETVKHHAGRLAEGIRDSIPEDLGDRVGDALESTGENLRTFGKSVASSIKGAFDDPDAVDWTTKENAKDAVDKLSSRVDQQLADVAKFLEEPEVEETKGEIVDAKVDEEAPVERPDPKP